MTTYQKIMFAIHRQNEAASLRAQYRWGAYAHRQCVHLRNEGK